MTEAEERAMGDAGERAWSENASVSVIAPGVVESPSRVALVDTAAANGNPFDPANTKREFVTVVTHPPHYTQGKIEVWDFILDQGLGYCEGNIVKYICRARHKGNELQDLEKARAYLERRIKDLGDGAN